MAELEDGCVQPAKGPIRPADNSTESEQPTAPEEVSGMQARVGREAPDFEANAFVRDEGFKPVRLSSYKGKWIVLCFYPGDFTFV